jgi:hypothetical protein
MSIAERLSATKPSLRISAPSEIALLAIVAGALLLCHTAIGVMVHRALPNESVAQLEQALAAYGD